MYRHSGRYSDRYSDIVGGSMFKFKAQRTHFYFLLVSVLFLTACGELPVDGQVGDPVAKPTLGALAGNNAPSQIEEDLLQRINNIRQTGQSCQGNFYASSEAIIWNTALAGAAKTHVKDVLGLHAQGAINVRTQAPPHVGSDGKRVDSRAKDQGYVFNTIAENLASSSNASPNTDKVLASWLSSTRGHCEVLVRSDLKDVGLYFENGVWAAVFGSPR